MPRITLLIIDMLNDFFQQQAVLNEQRHRLVESINALTEAFRNHRQPIIWVRQEFEPDLHDAFLDMRKKNAQLTIAGTEGSGLLPELALGPEDKIIVKKRYSAFFRTDLDEVLREQQPELLVVGGINTHACVRTTVIDAYQRDYEVVVASECIASYDEAHHEITKRYLDGGISRLLPNSEIIRMLAS